MGVQQRRGRVGRILGQRELSHEQAQQLSVAGFVVLGWYQGQRVVESQADHGTRSFQRLTVGFYNGRNAVKCNSEVKIQFNSKMIKTQSVTR